MRILCFFLAVIHGSPIGVRNRFSVEYAVANTIAMDAYLQARIQGLIDGMDSMASFIIGSAKKPKVFQNSPKMCSSDSAWSKTFVNLENSKVPFWDRSQHTI